MHVYINETGTYHKRRGGNMNGRNTGAVSDLKRENSIPTGENTSAEYLGILKTTVTVITSAWQIFIRLPHGGPLVKTGRHDFVTFFVAF